MKRIGLLLLLAVWGCNFVWLLFDRQSYLQFLAERLTFDGHINNPTVALIQFHIAFATGLIFLIMSPHLFHRDLPKLDTSTFAVILMLYAIIHLRFIPFISALYGEDRFLESLTAVFALLSSVLLLVCVKFKKGWSTKSTLFIISMFLFVFGMEEISWGQRIFGWETSVKWKEINYQQESNLHNLFNPWLPFLYPAFNFVVATVMLLAKKIRTKMEQYSTNSDFLNLFPCQESLFYSFIFYSLVAESILHGGELTEEIVSVIGLSYAIKQTTILK